jgi:hypothetical protein
VGEDRSADPPGGGAQIGPVEVAGGHHQRAGCVEVGVAGRLMVGHGAVGPAERQQPVGPLPVRLRPAPDAIERAPSPMAAAASIAYA